MRSFVQWLVCLLLVGIICQAQAHGETQCTVTVEERGQELHRALRAGELDTLESLLYDSCTTLQAANWRDSESNGLYHIAVSLSEMDTRIRALSLLGEFPGFNVNIVNKQHRAPLHIAILNDDVEAATLLLLAGADVMVPSDQGSALLLAKTRHNDELYKLLRRRFFHAKRSEAKQRAEAPPTPDIQT